jgi:hypothetical protein
MTQYLLSVYQPDGPAPPPARLEKIMQEAADLEPVLQWGRRLTQATGLPIEVRAFQDGG